MKYCIEQFLLHLWDGRMGLEINTDICALRAGVITWMSESFQSAVMAQEFRRRRFNNTACLSQISPGEHRAAGFRPWRDALLSTAQSFPKLCSAFSPSSSVLTAMTISCNSYRKMLDTCGDAENKLAMELSQHEVQIEREVLDPLCQLTEVR